MENLHSLTEFIRVLSSRGLASSGVFFGGGGQELPHDMQGACRHCGKRGHKNIHEPITHGRPRHAGNDRGDQGYNKIA